MPCIMMSLSGLSAASSEAEVQRGPTLSDCGSKMRSSVMLLWSVQIELVANVNWILDIRILRLGWLCGLIKIGGEGVLVLKRCFKLIQAHLRFIVGSVPQ